MPANRQSTPGFFNFMNSPSQRTTAALKDQQQNLSGQTASKTSPVAGQNPTNLTPVQPPLIITDELKNLPNNTGILTGKNSTSNNNNPTIQELNPLVKSSGAKNVLNTYRSYTYNFTLATLTNLDLEDPSRYRNSSNYYIIAKSGGKGTNAINSSAGSTSLPTKDYSIYTGTKPGLDQQQGQKLIKDFNTQSPGRFDFFIENVEIENIIAPGLEAGFSLPTSIRFDIIEPYSINGFIEALHVASVASGYPSYNYAVFLLKIEFTGYNDNDELPSVTTSIPKSTRYFPFAFTGLEVEVTERGTLYRCTAIPYEQRGFGHPNKLRIPMGMTGSSVEDILQNLMTKLNEQVEKEDTQSKKTAKSFDTYKIVFPSYVVDQGWVGTSGNSIGSSKVAELLKNNSVYKFRDPGDPNTNAENYKSPDDSKQTTTYDWQHVDPKEPQVQFSEGALIHDIISSVIRDSEYIREKLKNAETSIKDGFMDYFMVRMEVRNKAEFDHTANKPYQEFTYVVTPYKIHYSRIPNYGSLKVDPKQLVTYTQRTYNYFYTGENIDVLTFKLNFNTLYFEAIPNMLGNSDVVPSTDTAAPGNTNDVQTASNEGNSPDSLGRAGVKPVAQPIVPYGGTGQLPNYDPYAIMARNLHQALVNSKTSMITGDIDIIGDPFYLVTGGIGNYVPAPDSASPRATVDGDADHNFGEVLIQIIFNNPIDIGSDGIMKFDSSRVEFSGVYRVNRVINTFHDGMFKQKLDIIRLPGQINNNAPASNIGDKLVTTKKLEDTTLADTSKLPTPKPSVNINTK